MCYLPDKRLPASALGRWLWMVLLVRQGEQGWHWQEILNERPFYPPGEIKLQNYWPSLSNLSKLVSKFIPSSNLNEAGRLHPYPFPKLVPTHCPAAERSQLPLGLVPRAGHRAGCDFLERAQGTFLPAEVFAALWVGPSDPSPHLPGPRAPGGSSR